MGPRCCAGNAQNACGHQPHPQLQQQQQQQQHCQCCCLGRTCHQPLGCTRPGSCAGQSGRCTRHVAGAARRGHALGWLPQGPHPGAPAAAPAARPKRLDAAAEAAAAAHVPGLGGPRSAGCAAQRDRPSPGGSGRWHTAAAGSPGAPWRPAWPAGVCMCMWVCTRVSVCVCVHTHAYVCCTH